MFVRELTLTEKIIYCNGRLSGWKTFKAERLPVGTKSDEKLASAIVGQLTHTDAIDCLVKDWSSLPSQLRIRIATLCNQERNQPSSNNKAKMIGLLDNRLNGKVLRANDDNRMRDASGRQYREAVAAAQRKYANS